MRGETSAVVSVSGALGLHSASLAQDVVVSCAVHAHEPGRGKVGPPLVEVQAGLHDLMERGEIETSRGPKRRFSLPLTIPRAQLWGPASPVLYHATITLRTADGTLLDVATDRFGLRTLDIDGPYFVLNGARHFMNGMGDDCKR